MPRSNEQGDEPTGAKLFRRIRARRRGLANILLIGTALWGTSDIAQADNNGIQTSEVFGQSADAFASHTASFDLQQIAQNNGKPTSLVVARPLQASAAGSPPTAAIPQYELLFETSSVNIGDLRYSPNPADTRNVAGPLNLAQADQPRDPSAGPSPSQPADGAIDLDVDRLLGEQTEGTAAALGATNQLDLALGRGQVYSDLVTLEDRLTRMERPDASAVTRYSTQSDNLDISQTELSQEFFFSDGASRFRPGLQYVSYSPKTGYGVTQNSGGGDGSYRINDTSAISGDFWLNSIASANLGTALIPTYDLFLTLWPSDLVRIDIDTKRQIFDNITSLRSGIVAESEGGSIDFTPTDKLRLTVRANDSQYSDNNERQFAEAEAVWRVLSVPVIEVGFRASAFQFSKLLNDGYFNPNNYWSSEAVFRLQSSLSDSLKVELAASGGVERADPGGYKPLVKSSLQLTYQLSGNWALDGGIEYFSSQESTSSGFARTSANLGLHYTFD